VCSQVKGAAPAGGESGGRVRVRPWGGRPAPFFEKAYLYWAVVSSTKAQTVSANGITTYPYYREKIYRPTSIPPVSFFTT
jgi:hypothetical protein